MRACWPTITFSSAVIVAEQADVLERPRHAVLHDQVGPAAGHVPAVEADAAVGGLVEPGEHVEEGGLAGAVRADDRDDRPLRDLEVTSSTATRPPKTFVMFGREQTACRAVPGRSFMRAPPRNRLATAERGVARADALGELELASSLGDEALGPQHHHDHQQEAEDPERQLGQVEVEPDLRRIVVEDVRDQVEVDEREHDRAEHHALDRAQPAEDDHREDEDRERELELVGVDRVQVRAEEHAGDAAERRARRRRRAAWS